VTGELPPLVADPVDALGRLLRDRPHRRTVVGIVGLPGAGKSTLAHGLVDALNHAAGMEVAMALGMDGFHLSRQALRAFADPAAALAQRLRQIREAPLDAQAHPVGWPGFAHGVGDPVPDALQVRAGVRLVVLEGLYLLHDDHGWNLQGLMDTCWFLDTPLELALQRLSARHQATWGIPADAAAARIAGNDAHNAQIVLRCLERADARVPDLQGCGLALAG